MSAKEWLPDDCRRVAAALRDAVDLLSKHSVSLIGHDVIFLTLQATADIQSRMKVCDGHWTRPVRSPWPMYIHSADDRADADRQRMIDLAAGDHCGDDPEPTEQEMATVAAVDRIFFDCLIGRNPGHDWKVLRAMAAGANDLGVPHSRATDVRRMQCAAIYTRVKHLIPATKKLSVVWRLAA